MADGADVFVRRDELLALWEVTGPHGRGMNPAVATEVRDGIVPTGD